MRQQGRSGARAREGEPEAESDAARCGRPLNLRQIEVFQAIMQAGSVSGAGRMLHVSQPAVSQRAGADRKPARLSVVRAGARQVAADA
ncbi:LysR family transcriptional regulator [Cupriavidus sp. DF5525]|uniref:LysR family transcriptional regulator n=1 Tax=Cupriavidus sp. DF5525 TaxID=3160989 RepID=UPI0032DFC761